MNLLRPSVLAAFILSVFAPVAFAQSGSPAASGPANISMLVQVPASGPSSTLGFVSTGSSSYLLRAVGPSLAGFGAPNPVQQPQIHIYNAAGVDVTGALFSMKGFGTLVNDYWPNLFAKVGAFPLQPATAAAADAYGAMTPAAGAYSVQVTDRAGQGGTVLIELYALPYGSVPGQ